MDCNIDWVPAIHFVLSAEYVAPVEVQDRSCHSNTYFDGSATYGNRAHLHALFFSVQK